MKVKKCCLFVKEVIYFGYVIFEKGVVIDLSKIVVVKEWFVLLNVIEIRLFLGLCGYYCRFIKNFFVVVKCFYFLIEKGKLFVWIKEC